MLIRILSFLSVVLLTHPAHAACDGTDLRTALTSDEQARLLTELDGTPYPIGNHWRATKGDSVVHLIGTMHLSDPRLDGPAERLRPVIEAADLLLLEMTSEDEEELQTRLASDPAFLLMADTTLPEILSDPEWQQMSDALSARGMPPFVAARFQPWYVSMLLAIPPCASLQDLSAGGMDARLQDIAKGADVPRAALEDAASIFMAFAEQPRDVQVQMMLSALVDPDVSEDLFATLLASYFDENHAESWAVSAILAERYSPIDPTEAEAVMNTLTQKLLIDRNLAWIPVIVGAAEENDTIVAAFGAAHLPGEDGVLNLLAEEGFTLEQLPF